MPYVSATDLVGLLPGMPTITASSTPLTMGEVGSITARISAELDGAAAAAGYAVPVSTTATTAYLQMEDANVLGAGWRVLGRIYPNLGGPSDKMKLATEYRDAYRDFLKALRAGTAILVGAGEETGTGARELPRYTSTASAIMTMDTVF